MAALFQSRPWFSLLAVAEASDEDGAGLGVHGELAEEHLTPGSNCQSAKSTLIPGIPSLGHRRPTGAGKGKAPVADIGT